MQVKESEECMLEWCNHELINFNSSTELLSSVVQRADQDM